MVCKLHSLEKSTCMMHAQLHCNTWFSCRSRVQQSSARFPGMGFVPPTFHGEDREKFNLTWCGWCTVMVNHCSKWHQFSFWWPVFQEWASVSWFQNVNCQAILDSAAVLGRWWSCKVCPAPVRSPPPTCQCLVFTDWMPFLPPSQQWQGTEEVGHKL